jgi:signal transduction histidine kinase
MDDRVDDAPAREPSGIPALVEVLSGDSLRLITAHLSDYICAHVPVLGHDGTVVDCSLVWWNAAYERLRLTPVQLGQSMMATYYDPEVALGFVRRCMADGHAEQHFELGADAFDQYRIPEQVVRLHVDWLLVGSLIVEVGIDESRATKLELQIQEQELAVREVLQQRMRDLDRERIARDLHDSVIQQLFVTVLDLQTAFGGDTAAQQAAIHRAVETIDHSMTQLRKTIYAIGNERHESIGQHLQEVVESFGAAPFAIELQADLGVDLPDDLADDVSMVVLEALANVARHAHASRCQVRVAIDGRWLLVTVTDDGVGPPAEYDRMSGLSNMTERARLHGGWCWLRPGSKRVGSRLTWSVPLPY